MNLIFADRVVSADVRFVSESMSPVTGRPLATYEAQFMLPSHEALSSAQLSRCLLTLENGRVVRTSLTWSSDLGDVVSYTVQMDEVEVMEPALVMIEGQELRPTRYSEVVDSDGCRTITLIAPCEMGTVRKFHKWAGDAVLRDVARPDLVEATAHVRIEDLVYAQEDTGTLMALRLTDRPSNDDGVPWYASVGVGMRMAVAARARMKVLLQLLLSKGVIDQGEYDTIWAAEDEFGQSFLLLSEVQKLSDSRL
jgi:hypothetical protein